MGLLGECAHRGANRHAVEVAALDGSVLERIALTAGVRLEAGGLNARVTLGVVAGLVLGKTIGVFGGAWLAVRLGVGRLPVSVTWRHMIGLAVTAGIGFTVALYVTGLSFDDPAVVSSAKIGILAASSIAGALGFLLLRSVPGPQRDDPVAVPRPAVAAGTSR